MKYFYLVVLRFFDTFFKVDLFVSACVSGGTWGKEEFPPEPYSRFLPPFKSCIDLFPSASCFILS